MFAATTIALAASQAVQNTTDARFSIEVAATFTQLADINGSTESLAFAADQNLFYFVDQSRDGEIGHFLHDTLDLGGADFQFNVFSGALDSFSTTGTAYYYDGYNSRTLFVADSVLGSIAVIDVDTGSVTQSIYVGVGLKGLCMDGSTLFATAPGIAEDGLEYEDVRAGVWSIDLSEDDLEISRLYAGGVSTFDDDETYVLHPSACAVNEGLIYIVEERLNLLGRMAVYDLAAESMSLTTALSVSAEGIVFVDNYYIVVSSWAHNGGVWVLRDQGGDKDVNFELMIPDLGMAGPLCASANNIIALPVLDSGVIHWLRWQVPTPAPTMVVAPTAAPTTSVNGAYQPMRLLPLILAMCTCLSFI